LKIFECVCYIHNNKQDKLDYTSSRHFLEIFYTKGYKCYDPINHKFLKRCKFQENESYFKEMEKEINEKELSNTFTFPSIEYPREDETIVINEGEHNIEETPQIQKEENKDPQTQKENEEGSEEILLRRSNRIP
jgi:hypothetical protein